MSEFKHFEGEVAKRLGVSREEIRSLRMEHLLAGVDWILEKNRVALADSGVEKIAALLSPLTATERAVEPTMDLAAAVIQEATQAAAEAAGDVPVVLHVWRQTRNPKIIEAFRPGTDPMLRENVVRVRVKSSENFCRVGGDGKPMELPVVHLQSDLYELVGRCPRRKGRW